MSNSIGIRGILAVGTFAVLGLGLLPASASAITINRSAANTATITVTAAPGEVNNFDVFRASTGTPNFSYTFDETGANSFSLTGAAGCTASDSSPPTIRVTCVDNIGTASIVGVITDLGDGDDDYNAFTISGGLGLGSTDSFTVNGGDGNDVIAGTQGLFATDTMNGGNGMDRLTGYAGLDNYAGGAGIDRAVLTGASSGATVTLDSVANDDDGDGVADENVASDVESITGTPFTDTLTGNCAVANTFTGLGAADTLQDPAGCNTTEFFGGGAGNDTFIGQGGADTVTYTANTAAQAINVSIGGGGDTDGLGGTDTISADIETIYGTPGNDTISGSAAPVGVTLWGRLGNDTILGSGLNDVIRGEAGNDALNCQGGTNDMYVIDPADLPPATNCETPIGG